MKKILFALLVALLATVSMRGEIVATFEYVPGVYHPAVIPLPLYSNGVSVSLYGSLSPMGLIISEYISFSSSVGPMTKIVFEGYSGSALSGSDGSVTSGFWSGHCEEIFFSGSGQARRIIVYVDDSGSGGGDDPGESLTLCDLSTVEDGTTITFNRELVTLWQAGNYLYVKDRLTDCFGLIYGPVNQTYNHGDVIPAGWTARKMTYGGEPEFGHPDDFAPSVNHVEVTPEEITAEDVNHDYWAHYVVLKNVKVSEDGSVLIDENGNEISYYTRTFNVELPTGLDQPIDVYGIVGSYKPSGGNVIYQILPINFSGIPIPECVCCLQDLLDLYPHNQPVDFECPLIVIYQGGNYLYFKDTCGQYGLMYSGTIGGPFVNGDSIIGPAYWTTYQGAVQLGTRTQWQLLGHGPAVQPEVAFIEEMSWDQVHSYVRFEGVKIVTDEDGKTYIENEWGDRLLIFNRFNIEIPGPEYPIAPPRNPYDLNNDGEMNIADLNVIIDFILQGKIEYDWFITPQTDDGEMRWNVTGFLALYRNELEFFPVEITSAGGTLRIVGDLNGDNELNIADVNELIIAILNNTPI